VAAPRLEMLDSDEKDALFGIDTQVTNYFGYFIHTKVWSLSVFQAFLRLFMFRFIWDRIKVNWTL
jgi:hypothetical protein